MNDLLENSASPLAIQAFLSLVALGLRNEQSQNRNMDWIADLRERISLLEASAVQMKLSPTDLRHLRLMADALQGFLVNPHLSLADPSEGSPH